MNKKSKSIVYYLVRILHRLLLCITITLTGIYWASLVSIMVLASYISGLPNNEIKDAFGKNQIPEIIAQGLRASTLKWAVVATALSLLLLTFVRFRKYEKRYIADSVVIAIFCLLSALCAQAVTRLIYSPF